MSERTSLRWHAEMLGALGIIADGVHSNLEFRYVRDVERAHGLPAAKRQAKTVRGARSQYIDNLYEAFGVAVELDGRAAHPIEGRWRISAGTISGPDTGLSHCVLAGPTSPADLARQLPTSPT
jgi:hypothetical protein